jgi:tetratricopeptide (TPR) repeat protein
VVGDAGDPQLLVARAVELRAMRRWDEAEALYLSLEPKLPRQARAGLGYLSRERGDRPAALRHFAAAVEAEPGAAWLRHELATELRQAGRLDEAEAIWREIEPAVPRQARTGLGHLARARGDGEAAVGWFRGAVEVAPTDAWALQSLADALRSLGRESEAEEAYRALEPLNPKVARLALGQLARERGEREAAAALFREAAEADPSDPWPRIALAEELRALRRWGEAEAAYRALAAAQPKLAHLGLGRMARERGEREAALAAFLAAAEADPADAAPHAEAGTELRALGRFREAEALYGALEKAGHARQALLGRGYLARDLGDRAAALAHFQASLELDPQNPWTANEVAGELRHAGRLEEAEAIWRGIEPALPRQARSGLGHVARTRGDRAGAIAWFEGAAAVADPADPWPRLSLAEEYRDLGDFEAARAQARLLLERDPRSLHGWTSLGTTERHAGRHAEALAAFRRAAECHPQEPGPLLDMAAALRALGEPETAGALLARALEQHPENGRILSSLGEHARLANALEEALGFFERAIAAGPGYLWPHLAGAQTLAELGRREDAFALLDRAEARLGAASPDVANKRLELARQYGEYREALSAARTAAATWPQHFPLWATRFFLERLDGGPEQAAPLLEKAPPGATRAERARIHHFRGQVAEERGDLPAAIAAMEEGLALNPQDGWILWDLARLRLAQHDLDAVREALRRMSQVQAAAQQMQGKSQNISQTLIGQLLDEAAVDAGALARLRAADALPPRRRIGALARMVRELPDYTPAATALLVALRRAGAFAPGLRPSPEESPPRIPPRLGQYWDSASPPVDVARLMESWRAAHPRHAWRLFDDAAARVFLAAHYEPSVLLAYARAQAVAQRADLFRLAWLYVSGGFWLDADDRCLQPLDGFVPPQAELALVQEEFGTAGNNFIGAVPRHPVIGAALAMGVDAVNRGDADLLWLSTGPGLMTRALAGRIVADPAPDRLLRGLAFFTVPEIRRFVAFHCLAGYKKTERHWTNSAFRRQQRMAG